VRYARARAIWAARAPRRTRASARATAGPHRTPRPSALTLVSHAPALAPPPPRPLHDRARSFKWIIAMTIALGFTTYYKRFKWAPIKNRRLEFEN
jgi:hypothetical protein